VPIRLLAHHALWDAWIHERDIAFPLGETPPEEADEIRACLRYAAALAPALALGHETAPVGAYAVASEDPGEQFLVEVRRVGLRARRRVAEGRTLLAGRRGRLVEALSIRAPLPADAPDEWYRVLNGLATVFDSELDVR
jgi:ribosomal protein L34